MIVKWIYIYMGYWPSVFMDFDFDSINARVLKELNLLNNIYPSWPTKQIKIYYYEIILSGRDNDILQAEDSVYLSRWWSWLAISIKIYICLFEVQYYPFGINLFYWNFKRIWREERYCEILKWPLRNSSLYKQHPLNISGRLGLACKNTYGTGA